jgi:hypothetical protein
MKKTFATFALALMSFSLTQSLPALADNYWFDHWDHNHDHHWDYNEFRRAHRAWEHEHHNQQRLTDAQLQAEWAKLDAEHRGWVEMEKAKHYHNWY